MPTSMPWFLRARLKTRQLMLLIAIGDEGFSVRSTDVANLELSDTPTGDSAAPTAVSTVSAFQTNMRTVLCERRVSVRIFDTDAVASLSGIQWGPISTDSPMNA